MGLVSILTNKKVISFIGGVAVATIGVKVLKSQTVRNAAVKTIAGGLKLQECAQTAFETLKEDAQDLHAEARLNKNAEDVTAEE
jgi:hypothetical protein